MVNSIAKRIKHNILDIEDEKTASEVNASKAVDSLQIKFPDYQGTIEYKIYDIETSVLY